MLHGLQFPKIRLTCIRTPSRNMRIYASFCSEEVAFAVSTLGQQGSPPFVLARQMMLEQENSRFTLTVFKLLNSFGKTHKKIFSKLLTDLIIKRNGKCLFSEYKIQNGDRFGAAFRLYILYLTTKKWVLNLL